MRTTNFLVPLIKVVLFLSGILDGHREQAIDRIVAIVYSRCRTMSP